MPTSQARIATAKPAPYMKQLCRHFGHKCDVSFDDERGRIEFGSEGATLGTVELDATAPEVLVLTATAQTVEALERVEQIAGSHLERFGRRDSLEVAWAASSPG